jgi:GntR family transcriptional regulator
MEHRRGRARPQHPSGDRDHASRRVRDLLRSNIHSGAYPDGFLPDESALMAAYGATRAAIREALAMLRREGMIDRLQGMGTFVTSNPEPMGLREGHGVFRPEHGSVFDGHRTTEIDRSRVPTPEVVAFRLDCERGASCLRVEYVATAQGEVLALATNYVLYPEAASIEMVPLEQSWYHLLERGHLTVGESEFRIGCTNADEHTASLLAVKPASAVLTLEQVIRDDDGRAYNFALAALRGDRDCFVSRARRGVDGGQRF